MELYLDLYTQCETSDRLTDEICYQLEQLPYNERHLLVNFPKDHRAPPLVSAVKRGALGIVKYLLEKCKADVDKWSPFPILSTQNLKMMPLMTPLMFVTDLTVARCLVEHGANINVTKDNGYTALTYQCLFAKSNAANVHIVQYLIQLGADVNAHINGGTILHEVVEIPEVHQLLVRGGASVNALDNNQRTPLHKAIEKNALWAVQSLIKNGADQNLEDIDHCNAIWSACVHCHMDIFEHLLQNVNYLDDHKADVYELMGAFQVTKHQLTTALECWTMALRIRRNCGGQFLEKTSAHQDTNTIQYEDIKEFQTEEALKAIVYDRKAMFIQSYLIKYRVLGRYSGNCPLDPFNFEKPMYKQFIQRVLTDQEIVLDVVFNNPEEVADNVVISAYVIVTREKDLKFLGNVIEFEVVASLAIDLFHWIKSPKVKSRCFQLLLALFNLMIRMTKTQAQLEEMRKIVTIIVQQRLCNYNGYSLLHFAASGFKQSKLWSLLSNGDFLSYPRTPLVKLLLDCGHPVDFLSNFKSTALCYVASNYDEDVVNCLLEHGAHIDRVCNDGVRPCDLLDQVPGFKSFKYLNLQCLAAQAVVGHKVSYNPAHFPHIASFISMH